MSLGKKLKSLRVDNNFSQPELADIIGIEQSYLSKLENDKSVPSNEIFNKILAAFNLSVEQFLADFTAGEDLTSLKQIPEVAQYYKRENQIQWQKQRQFLYLSSLLIVLACTVFYMAYSKLVFPELQYQYESEGVFVDGESEDIFHNWRRLMTVEDAQDRAIVDQRQVEMQQRRHEHILLSPVNRGKHFVIPVEGGFRKYQLDTPTYVPQAINTWLQVLGVMLFVAGLMGFVLERRLFRLQ
tara:strand:+ start:168 stop:890 length:723 start_codon:yes stop_codon:yes gene_type:complete